MSKDGLVRTVGIPKDMYKSELVPNFFNHLWTATGGLANYYFSDYINPFNKTVMDTNILGNPCF